MIAEAKKKHLDQNEFISHGPEFVRHGFCIFGKTLYVSLLNDESCAVFSSESTLELWYYPPDSKADLKCLVTLNLPNILTVTEISRKNSDLQVKNNSDSEISANVSAEDEFRNILRLSSIREVSDSKDVSPTTSYS